MAVSRVGAPESSSVHGVSSAPPSQNLVVDAVRSFFETIRNALVSAWKAFVVWIKESWTLPGLIFFRVMNFVLPSSWVQKLEVGYLYCADFFKSLGTKQKESSLQSDIAKLRIENGELTECVRRVSQEKQELHLENTQLKNENEQTQAEIDGTRRQHSLLKDHCKRQEEEIARLHKVLEQMGKDKDLAKDYAPLVKEEMESLRRREALLTEQLEVLKNELDVARQDLMNLLNSPEIRRQDGL